MEFETNYALKLFFPNPAFIQVYHEAVANAFDANATEVNITIATDGNLRNPSHLEITISDNGVGFTKERFVKFREVKEPNDPYHKGMGRLVFLRYFSNVHVKSHYDGLCRIFTFSEAFDGKSRETHLDCSSTNDKGTTLTFKNFIGERIRSYEDLKPTSIKEALIEQFLPRLIEMKNAGKTFIISIELQTVAVNQQYGFFQNKEILTEKDIPDFVQTSFKDECLDMFSDIKISFLIRKGTGLKASLIAACVDGRTIPIEILRQNAIPIDHSVVFLISSDLFTGKSDNARQKLILPETVPEAVFYKRLRKEISKILSNELPIIQERNTATKMEFDNRYPHLRGYFEAETVGLINRDEAIEIAQNQFFKGQKEILDSDTLDDRRFEKSLEISSRTLTEYVLYRELIIRRLQEMSEKNSEADIHNLIVPRYNSFQGDNMVESIYSNNAWLLDDKFMTFRTILSEARMADIIRAITLEEEQEKDGGRPDIAMIFSAEPDGSKGVDVVVIEIKKRTIDDKENPYATTQLIKRARKLVDHCNNIQRVWYYAVVEIDDDLAQLLQDMNWTPLFSKGRVFYQDFKVKRTDGFYVPTPTCLLSYNAVIADAAARNHTFLEILKNALKKAEENRR